MWLKGLRPLPVEASEKTRHPNYQTCTLKCGENQCQTTATRKARHPIYQNQFTDSRENRGKTRTKEKICHPIFQNLYHHKNRGKHTTPIRRFPFKSGYRDKASWLPILDLSESIIMSESNKVKIRVWDIEVNNGSLYTKCRFLRLVSFQGFSIQFTTFISFRSI